MGTKKPHKAYSTIEKRKNTRYLHSYVFFVILSLFILSYCVNDQAYGAGGDIIWQYGDTPQTGKQEAKEMAVDSAGNAVIIGYSDQSGTGKYYTLKISSDGSGVIWSAAYDSQEGDDSATHLIIDSDDNVIVTGYIWNGANFDFHTIKYKGIDGTVLWQHTFNTVTNGNDYAPAVAVDSLNNVYVSGISQGSSAKDDYILIKYSPNGPNPDGTPIWQAIYNGAADGHDKIASITAGIDGIALTGSSQNASADFDFLTIKYGFDGSLIWEKRYSVLGNDGGKAVSMDPSGNIIVTGTAYNGTNKDIYTVKYAGSTGAVLWEQTYNGGYDEEPIDIFVDSFGDVYITGYTFVFSSANDIYTAKYDGSSGTLQWSNTYNSANGNNDRAVSIVVDESGDLFVAGDSYDESLTNYNFHTLKLTKESGTLLWQNTFSGAAGKDDRAAGIDITSSGEPIVAGWSDSWTGGASDYDYYAVKYDPGLLNPPTDLTAASISTTEIALSWSDNASNEDGFKIERKIGDLGTYSEIATVGVNVTAYNNTLLSPDTKYYYRARAYNSTEGDSYYTNEAYAVTTIVSFDPPALTHIYNGPSGGDDRVSALAAGDDNTPVITGYSYSLSGQFDYYTLKLNRETLGLEWDVRYDSDQNSIDMAKTIAIDSNNDVIVSGYSNMFSIASMRNTNDIYTIKYPSNGPPEDWNDQYNGPAGDDDRSSVVDVSRDGSNNYVVIGYGRNADWNDDIYVVKYMSNGTLAWAAVPYDGGISGHDYPSAAAFDASGDVFVTGSTYNGADYDYFTRKHNGSDGSVIWTDVYNIAGAGNDFTRSLSVDSSGNVFITGIAVTASGNEDFYTIKYDGTDGNILWEKAYNGLANGIDEAMAVKVDPVNNDVVVAGTTLAGAENNEFHVIRYDPDGNVVWERTLDRPSSNDFVTAMAMDRSGNVHIVGDTDSGDDTNALTLMYDHEGSFIDGSEYSGSAGDDDRATAVAVNTIGEAFVGGYTYNAESNSDYLVFKINGDDLQAPSPFYAAFPDYTDIDLIWIDNAVSENGYYLERKIGNCSSANSWVLLYDAPAGTTSYSDTGLNLVSEYCYRVKAYNNSGKSSRWVEISTSTATPQAPSGLAATNNSTEVALSWTDNSINETGFTIQRCTGALCDFSSVTEINVGTDIRAYLDDTACESTTYRYRVKSYKTGLWATGYSNIIDVTTASIAVPTALTASRISEVEVGLSWSDWTGDESGFRIERCAGEACTKFDLVTTAAGIPDATSLWRFDEGSGHVAFDELNSNNGSVVSASRTAGMYGGAVSFDGFDDYVHIENNSSWDLTGDITISFLIKHADVSGLQTYVSRVKDASFYWTIYSDEGVVKFEHIVDESTVASGSFAAVLDTNWHHITFIKSGNTYELYLDGASAGTLSAIVADPFSAYLRLGAKKNSLYFEGIMDEVVVYDRALSSSEILSQYNNGVPRTLKYSDTGLASDISYTYRVMAYKTAVCSWETIASNTASAFTNIIDPAGLSASTIDSTRIDLAWTDNTVSETGFRIERCTGASCNSFVQIDTVGANVTSYPDMTVCEGTTYRYRVRAYNDPEWNSGYTDEVSAATTAMTAPATMTATPVSESQIDIAWTDNSNDETGFEIERCIGSGCDAFELLTTTPGTPANDAVSVWKFDEGSGTTAYDGMPANNDGTINEASWTAGKYGSALNFSGNNDYLDVGSVDIGSAWSIEAWFKYPLASTGSWNTLIRGSSTDHHIIVQRSSMLLGTYMNGDGAFRSSGYVMSGLSAGWHHITAVGSSGSTHFYIDGQPVGTSDRQSTAKIRSIGNYWGGSQQFGTVDEVIMYARALSATEISSHYENGVSLSGKKYSDTGLDYGIAYTYRLRAYKDALCSWQTAYINTAEKTTLQPPAPSNLTTTVINSTQIDLAWADNTASETDFMIQRCTGAGCDFSSSVEFAVAADATSYSDTSLCENTTYRYRVRAEKNDAPIWQTDWAVTAADSTTPAAIAPTVLTAATFAESQIDIQWTDNTDDETGFKVERCMGADCTNFLEITPVMDIDTTMVLSMHMSEASWSGASGEIIDSSNYGNHGTSYNGADTAAEGKYGRAGSFDGVDDFVQVADNNILALTTAGSIEVWAYKDTQKNNQMYVTKGHTKAFQLMDYGTTGRIALRWGSDTNNVITDAVVPTGGWHHIVGTYDGIDLKIYIDGELSKSVAYATDAINNSYPLRIGARDDGNYFDGRIDEVALYNRALTESEILNRYKGSIGSNHYSDTGLTTNEIYRYRVSAYKDAECAWSTGYSNEAEDFTLPPPPSDFAANALNTTRIDITWTESLTAETGFKVERCTGAECTDFTEIATTTANVTSYSDTAVCENSTYKYRVSGYKDLIWETAYTGESLATTFAKAAPDELSATRISELQVDISWMDNSQDESGFTIERCSGAQCSDFEVQAAVGANKSSYTDMGIAHDTSYTYRVNAYKTSTCGWITDHTNASSATTGIDEPDGLLATAVNTTQIDLSWTDNTASETGFVIERCAVAECDDFLVIDTVGAGVSSYSDNALCNSTTYSYRVKARQEGSISNDAGGCWTRMTPLAITDFTGEYPIRITVAYDPDMQPDFSDIRFYNSTAGIELPYWIESKTDGISATVHFRTIDSSSLNDINMFYGNTNALSSSDVFNTFDLYDPANPEIVSDLVKYAANPVINLGADGTWDDAHLYGISVIKDGDTHKMWYGGQDGTKYRIGYATSGDGINWTRHASNPVLSTGNNWDNDHAVYPVVIKDGSIYKMWYSGNNGFNWRIGYATSSDGINWTKYASNPVLDRGGSGAWDDEGTLVNSVIKNNDGTYSIWYSGYNGGNWRIGYATSSNGINWTKYASNPVLNLGGSGAWDDAHVYLSTVFKDNDGTYKMWYTGHSGQNTRIGYASSNNGVNWIKYGSNPVLDIGGEDTWENTHVYGPAVIKDTDASYKLWYSGYDGSHWRIGYASVRPGIDVSVEPAVSIGAEEQSACYTYDSWDTAYSGTASATTLNLNAPTVLMAAALNDTEMELTWTDNSIDETGFSIARCADDGCTDYLVTDTAGSNAETYIDSGIDPETIYCYRVRSFKTAACGWNTSYSSESCDLTYSGHPALLTATALNSVLIRLDWTDSSDNEEGYEVEKLIFNGTFINIATLGPNVTTFTNTMEIQPDKEYTYRVRAFRGDDYTPYSNEASVITPPYIESDDTCVE